MERQKNLNASKPLYILIVYFKMKAFSNHGIIYKAGFFFSSVLAWLCIMLVLECGNIAKTKHRDFFENRQTFQ